MIRLRTLGVHSGSFHADEVTAAALLLLHGLIDKKGILRTRDALELTELEFVCDVGGIYDPRKKRFDHHQVEYRGPLSSAGMVLLYLKEERIIDSELYDVYNKSLILGVDAHDNGVAKMESGTASFSHVVSNFLPVDYNASKEEMDRAFLDALDFVYSHLDRLRKRYLYTLDCKALVKKVMSCSTEVLLFEESIPWMDNFFDLGGEVHPAKFIIMPSGSQWKLRGIPPSLHERMKVRSPLPAKWGGLLEKELKNVSGIDGAVFCHKGRFISIWETKEDALKAYRIIVGKSGNSF